MDINQLVERAKAQLNAGSPQPRVWPEAEIDLAACVRQASERVAYEVMRDAYLRALLQQTYAVNLDSAGQGDLLTATGSITGVAGEILLDGIRYGVVLDFDGNQLQPILHYADFLRPQPTVYGYYLIKDRDKILTRAKGQQVNNLNEIQGANGPLSILASFVPASVTNFPPELDDRLVQKLCDIVVRKITPANANAG